MRRTAAAAALLALLLALLAAVLGRPPAAAAQQESEEPAPNPDLPLGCGIDIHVILDESGSVSNYKVNVQQAFRAFTSALANTGSRMAVSEFSTVARLPLTGAAQRAYTTVTNGTINSIFNPYINTNYTPGGSTNWEDGLRMGRYFLPRPSADLPHLTVFITDGDPNKIIRDDQVTPTEYQTKVPLSDSEVADANNTQATDRAVPNANAIKAQGSHILAVAVGAGLTNPQSLARLIRVSGPNVYSGVGDFDITTHDVYRVPDFANLEAALREAAFQLCAPSVNIRKQTDENPDPAVDDLQPGQGWSMTANVTPVPAGWVLPSTGTGSTATSTTGADGFVTFQWTNAGPITSNITVTEVVQPGYENDPSATRCTFRTPDNPTDRPLPGFNATNGRFSGTVPDQAIVTCDMINRRPPAPAVEIEKSTNGVDADDPPGPFVQVGSTVTWSYLVTNTGNVPLSGIGVTDNQPGVTVTCPPGNLAPGATKTCTATGTGVAGQYANIGSVTATGAGQTVNDSDPSHYLGVQPGIDIEKATNGVDADLPPGPFIPVGGTVTWTYVVTNTGDAVLNGVAVTDSVLGPITCPAALNPLDPDESVTCTATGTAAAGQYENTGSVVGTSPTGPVQDSDASHYFGEAPSVDIEKSTNLQDADDPPGPLITVGGRVLWRYLVTNTGNVPLRWVVTDDQAPFTFCPRLLFIVPGQSIACFSQGTAEPGQYANIGEVVGTSPSGQQVTDEDPSHYFGVQGGISIVKSTGPAGGPFEDANTPPGPFITPGDPVAWTYLVTNTGNIALSNIEVVDNHAPDVAVSCPLTSLVPGQFMLCGASATATAGQYTNFGTATGETPLGVTVQDDDPSNYFGADPGINLEKTVNGDDADEAPGPFVPVGGALNYQFIVTNSGNVPLTGATVTDNVLGTITCPPAIDPLAVGEEVTCTAGGTSVRGHHANIGSVTAQPPTGPALTDTDPAHYFGFVSQIQIKKFTNGQDADAPTGPVVRVGDPVTWSYRVTNPGNVPIKSPRVTDNRGVTPGFIGGDADGDTDLDPGEAWTYMATGVGRVGQYSNVGTVSGLDLLENPVADSDPSHYLGRRCLPIPGDTTPPFLAVNARRNQLKSVALARGVHARIRTERCVTIRTKLVVKPKLAQRLGIERRVLGRAMRTLTVRNRTQLRTRFYPWARRALAAYDQVPCIFLHVRVTDLSGNWRSTVRAVFLRRRL